MELGKIFEKLLDDKEYFKENREYFLENEYGKLKTYNSGEVLLRELDVINKAVVLVEGEVYISRYSREGRRIITGRMEEGQIFNLLEITGGRTRVEGTVVALGNCTTFEVPINILKKSLEYDHVLLKIALEYISAFALDLMEMGVKRSSLSPEENILQYIFELSSTKEPPVEIGQSKNFIADLFGINVRSLYRYLNEWEEEGLLKRVGQKIVVDKKNLHRIKDYLEDL